MTESTYGVRWRTDGYFYVSLMWMDCLPPHCWLSSALMVHKRYKSLERALKAFEGDNYVVMIFPA
jgi:hypothetical protein